MDDLFSELIGSLSESSSEGASDSSCEGISESNRKKRNGTDQSSGPGYTFNYTARVTTDDLREIPIPK